jgi:two-component system, OmpR family, phosphate regulon response regulator PhoB
VESKATILVVEDSRFVRTAAATSLQGHGFTVREATTGDEALRLARQSPPDVILLDFFMPGLQGREVLAILKQDDRTRHVPVIVMSGESPEVAKEALRFGAHAFLAKQNASVSELLALVDLVLAKRVQSATPPHAAKP